VLPEPTFDDLRAGDAEICDKASATRQRNDGAGGLLPTAANICGAVTDKQSSVLHQ
jgi:hypothetical protein